MARAAKAKRYFGEESTTVRKYTKRNGGRTAKRVNARGKGRWGNRQTEQNLVTISVPADLAFGFGYMLGQQEQRVL